MKDVLPITAVHFTDSVGLIAGEGPNLLFFPDIYSPQLFHLSSIFLDAQTFIHGIRISAFGGLAFGKNKVRFFNILNSGKLVQYGNLLEYELSWIFDIQFFEDDDHIAVLGNDRLIFYDFINLKVTKSVVRFGHKPIPYSGIIIKKSRLLDSLVIFGSVFGDISLWNSDDCLLQISGHAGPIFSLDFYPESSQLATASDDRTIKIWKYDETLRLLLTHTCSGHIARIWSVKWFRSGFVSVGEDCKLCWWNNDGSLVHTFNGHLGRNIWCVDVQTVNDELLCVTGGADGAIKVWKLKHDMEPICQKIVIGEDIQHVVFYSQSVIITATNTGKLYCIDIEASSKDIIFEDDNFASYSVLATLEGAIAFGDIIGFVHFFWKDQSGWCSTGTQLCQSKIMSICKALSDSTMPKFLISSVDFSLYYGKLHKAHQEITITKEISLPRKSKSYATCACVHLNQLFVGDRFGSIHTYSLFSEDEDPTDSIWKLHGNNGVTSLSIYRHDIFSCGRDGIICQLKLSSARTLEVVKKIRSPLNWISGIFWNPCLHSVGFNSVNFEIFDHGSDQKLVSVECGGGHRSYDYRIDNWLLTLFFVKKGKLFCVKATLPRPPLDLRPSFHGQSINSSSILKNGEFYTVALGSEDTTISLFSVDPDSLEISKFCRISSHISSVKCVRLVKHGDSMFLLSGGGRGEVKWFRIYEVDDVLDFEVMLESSVIKGAC